MSLRTRCCWPTDLVFQKLCCENGWDRHWEHIADYGMCWKGNGARVGQLSPWLHSFCYYNAVKHVKHVAFIASYDCRGETNDIFTVAYVYDCEIDHFQLFCSAERVLKCAALNSHDLSLSLKQFQRLETWKPNWRLQSERCDRNVKDAGFKCEEEVLAGQKY